MSHIPSIREKNSEYYEGNLNKESKDVLQGFDICVKDADNFFCNLSTYGKEYCSNTSCTFDDIDFETFLDKDFEDYSDEEIKNLTDNQKIILITKMCLMDWLEWERNELGISLTENETDEEKNNAQIY